MDGRRELTRLNEEFQLLNGRFSLEDINSLLVWAENLRKELVDSLIRQGRDAMLSADIHQLDALQNRLRALGIVISRSNTAAAAHANALEVATRESLDQIVLRPRPASKAAVEALEKLVFDGGVVDGLNDDQCVVCLENMLCGEQVTRVQCSHIFHGDCILRWLNQCHTCPVCRFKLACDQI